MLRKVLARGVLFLLLAVILVFTGFPLYWMVNTALARDSEMYRTGQDYWIHFERLGDIPEILSQVQILTWLGNSTTIAVGVAALSLCMAVLAGYALSRYRFHGKGIASVFLFATQMLPEALLVVPLFALFGTLGLLNGLHGLVLANTAFTMPVATLIIKGAVDKVPYELEESARVDGCSRFSRLNLIVLPLILPSIAAAAVINFFDGWNEFLFANTFIRDVDKWPASVGLASLMGQYSTPLSSVMLSAIAFTLPAIVFFLLVQRQIISGLTAGAVKG